MNRSQEDARRERLPLGQILVRDDLVASRVLATLTALHLGLTMVELRSETIDREAVRMVPEEVARKYIGLPVNQRDGHLTVAMTDPTDLQLLQDLLEDMVEAALFAVHTVVTAEGGSSTGGTLYNMTAVSFDGTVTQYRAIVTSDGEDQILDWPQ